MNIFIASDHAGFELKKTLTVSLTNAGHTVVDCGAYSFDEHDDYPIYISKAAKAVSEAEAIRVDEDEAGGVNLDMTTCGIVIGGSGQGEAIVANKFAHIRAAVCHGGEHSEDIVRLSREHNNANILSLGARFMPADQALELVFLWLKTPFSGSERQVRRLHEIEELKHQPLYE